MRFWAMLACMAAAMLAIQPAHAETHVELLGTWPAGDMVTLHRNQNFYMHFGYRSDQPVQIWVQPYFEGKQVNAGSNPSRTHPAGSGEALGWFFLSDQGTQVDEVKVTAGDGSYDRTPVVATFPVAVTGDDAPAESAAQPAWLASLSAVDQAARRADYEKAVSTPPSAGDVALFSGFMLAMFTLGSPVRHGACGAGAAAGEWPRCCPRRSWLSWCCVFSSTPRVTPLHTTCGHSRY